MVKLLFSLTKKKQKGKTMNKGELIKKFAHQQSISIEEASLIVNIFFDTIKDALKQEQRVEIRGFGSFKIKHYKGYKGRNPKTGESIYVAPKRLPFFKVGKELKERLNKNE